MALVCSAISSYIHAQPCGYARSHHNRKLMQLYAKTSCYQNSFLPRTIRDWNHLGIQDLVNCDFDTFKRYLCSSNY